jgi:hypothetical protein
MKKSSWMESNDLNVVVSAEKELKLNTKKNRKMRICPFCKDKGILHPWDEGDYPSKEGAWMPGCASGEHIMNFVGTKEECIDFWNYRKHF